MAKMNKNKVILASTAATLSVASIVALPFATNNNNDSNINLETNARTKKIKAISPNSGAKDNLTNPTELFFSNPLLSPSTHPILVNGVLNDANLALWKKFSDNIAKISVPSSLPQSVKSVYNELKNIATEINKSVELNRTLIDAKEAFEANIRPILEAAGLNPGPFWDIMKEKIVTETGASEDINNIPGINAIGEKLLLISGITAGDRISSITGYEANSFVERNLATDGNTSPLSIGQVAGADYVQLIKIATIDPSAAGNYALNFTYAEGPNAFNKTGTIYILNKNGQLQNAASAKSLVDSLDIFGRWESNVLIDDKSKIMENFIIQKNSDAKFEILVRVKNNASLRNIKFLKDGENGVENVEGLIQPAEFGILDVQASETQTFRDKIKADNSTTKLVNISDQNIVTSIQMFGTKLTAVKAKSGDIVNDRKLEFYQGPNSVVELGLNYATRTAANNANELDYYPIEIYESGISSGTQRKITLETDGANPSLINGTKSSVYDLYKDTSDKLPTEVKDNFDVLSTITLNSTFDTNSKLSKQSLTYSDYFYAVGNRIKSGYDSVDISKDISNIEILDPTQKIFFEKPLAFIEAAGAPTEESTIRAVESVNERTQVLSILGETYNQFSKSNSGDFAGKQPFNLGSISVWVSDNGKNIHNVTQSLTGSANDLYRKLNDNWTQVSEIMKNLFGSIVNNIRYDGSTVQSAKDAVNNYLSKVTEFTQNSSDIEKVIEESIKIVKDSTQGGSITEATTYDTLTSEVKDKLADQVASLIKFQFEAINNEFESEQYKPIYVKLAEIFKSTATSNYKVLKAAAELFSVHNSSHNIKVVTWQSGAKDTPSTDQNTTLKTAFEAFFNVLYFDNGAGTKIGESIFNTSEVKDSFASLDAKSLTTFDVDTPTSRRDKVLIYNKLLSNFAPEEWHLDFQAAIAKMLKEGKPIQFNVDLADAFRRIINDIGSNTRTRIGVTEGEEPKQVLTYHIDDLLSGANIISCMKYKLETIVGPTPPAYMSSVSKVERTDNTIRLYNNIARIDASKQELYNRINSILNTNAQSSSKELSIWAKNTLGDFNYSSFSEMLSGREGTQKLEEVIEMLINDENILKTRSYDEQKNSALIQLENILKQLWWIVVALVGAGILVASSVGVATKDRKVRLSSRPVLKWLLISGIILGLIVTTLAILIGIF